jgi:zinc/manganese transport system substrate-binding protein
VPPTSTAPRRLPGAPVRRRTAALTAATVLLGVTALLGAACSRSGGSATASSPVVATTSILADVTRQVACGRLDVPSIIPRGADAHEFEPSIQDADRLRDARLVVANGLNLEEGLRDGLEAAGRDGVPILRVGPRMSPRTLDGVPDPHVWMDPDRMARAVAVIADRLQQVDGLAVDDADIRRCAADYSRRLTALGLEMDRTLAVVPADRRKLVTNHESLGYFADRFDFDVIGAVIPSTSSLGESNPRDLDELAATVRAAGVPAIFAETSQPAAVADALAKRIGTVGAGTERVRVETLFTEALGPPGGPGGTYEDMLRADAATIAGALGTPTGGG